MPKIVTELRMNMTRLSSGDPSVVDDILAKIKPERFLVVREKVNGSNVHFHMWTESTHSPETLKKIMKMVVPTLKMKVNKHDARFEYLLKGNKISKGNGYDFDLAYDVVRSNLDPDVIAQAAQREKDWLDARDKPTGDKPYSQCLQDEFTQFLSTFQQRPTERFYDLPDEDTEHSEHIIQGAAAFVKSRKKIPQKRCLDNIVWGLLTKSNEYGYEADLRRQFMSR